MSLGYSVNKEKNGALISYIATKVSDLNLRKLLKIVYLIDEQFMRTRAFPLTWFDYYAWVKGPVAPEVYDIKYGNFSDFVSCRENEDGKYIIKSTILSPSQLSEMMEEYSLSEMKIIDEMIDKYGKLSADELTDITHQTDSLWSRIVSDKMLDFRDSKKSDEIIPLSSLNHGDSYRESVYSEARWNMEFQDSLNR